MLVLEAASRSCATSAMLSDENRESDGENGLTGLSTATPDVTHQQDKVVALAPSNKSTLFDRLRSRADSYSSFSFQGLVDQGLARGVVRRGESTTELGPHRSFPMARGSHDLCRHHEITR